MRANERMGISVPQPKAWKERCQVAATCARSMKIALPIAVDGMDDYVERCYSGMPDRLAVVARGGELVYYGARGPRGFKPEEAAAALKRELARAPRPTAAERRRDLEDALDSALD